MSKQPCTLQKPAADLCPSAFTSDQVVGEDDHHATHHWSNYKHLRNPNLGERSSCHISSYQWTLKWSKLVKSGEKVKDWSKERSLIANIDIFGCLCKIGLKD